MSINIIRNYFEYPDNCEVRGHGQGVVSGQLPSNMVSYLQADILCTDR